MEICRVCKFSGMSELYTPSSEVLSSVVGLLEMDSAELLGDVMLILRKLLKTFTCPKMMKAISSKWYHRTV